MIYKKYLKKITIQSIILDYVELIRIIWAVIYQLNIEPGLLSFSHQQNKMFVADQGEEITQYITLNNVFANGKYPIYFTYHPNTMHTYLTKIIKINSKDQRIIEYYKHHINMNVLPYLKQKYCGQAGSLLRLDGQYGECVIKQNLKLKEQKLENDRKQLQQIDKLLSELIMIDNVLQDNDKTANQLYEVLSASYQNNKQTNYHKSQLYYKMQKDIQKLLNIMKLSNEQNKQEGQKQQFQQAASIFQESSKKWLNQLVKRKAILKKSIQFYQNYCIEGNVLYITKKYIKGVSLRSMILIKDKRLDNHKFCLNLVAKMIDFMFMHGGIPNLLLTTENIIIEDTGQIHLNYFSFAGIDFINFDKYVSKDQVQEILPYLSEGYLYDKERRGRKMLRKEVMVNTVIWNFVSAFFKKDLIFSEKYINLEYQVNKTYIEGTFKTVKKQLMPKILSKQEIQKFIKFDEENKVNYFKLFFRVIAQENSSNKYIKQHYEAYYEKYDIQNKKIQNLQWQQIFEHLQISSRERDNYSKNSNQEDKGIFKVKPSQLSKMHIYLDISVMQIIDHFISILNCLADPKISLFQQQMIQFEDKSMSNLQYLKTKLNNSQFSKVQSVSRTLIYQRQYYIKQSFYQKQLFIPIKFGFKPSNLIHYSSFIQYLTNEKTPNSQNIKALINLTSFLLQMKEVLIILQPYLSSNWIKQALQDYRYKYFTKFMLNNQANKKKILYTYYLHMTDYKDRMLDRENNRHRERGRQTKRQQRSDEYDDNNNEYEDNYQNNNKSYSSDGDKSQQQILTNYNLKTQFWNKFFYIYNKLMLFIKRYYLKIQEIQITPFLKINGAKYTQIMQYLEERVPLLSSIDV